VPSIDELAIADEPAAWSHAGFDVADGLSPRDAVQAGRRSATLRPEAGLGAAIAFMTSGADAI
jgi:hypothetical protein